MSADDGRVKGNPLDIYSLEISGALAAGLYYLALKVSLSLPDVCSALESPDGLSSGKRYQRWCEEYLLPEYPQLTALDVYSLRCGVVHQGRVGHPKSQYARVIFTLPDGRNNVFHRNQVNDALNLDLIQFCSDVLGAVARWFQSQRDNPVVDDNLSRLVRYHRDGMAPYMVGIPIIT